MSTAEEYGAVATARGLSLLLDLDPDLGPVETDPARVRQIIGKLLSNAIKYTETGLVTLRIQSRVSSEAAEKDAELAIEVIDTGPGIPADKHEIIFNEFVRLGTGDPTVGRDTRISEEYKRFIVAASLKWREFSRDPACSEKTRDTTRETIDEISPYCHGRTGRSPRRGHTGFLTDGINRHR